MNVPIRRFLVTMSACAALVAGAVAAQVPVEPVVVQILAVNDFHGNLMPPSGSTGRVGESDAGGVEYLATHIQALRSLNPRTVVVSAGDLIGGTPLLSSLFHDEPTIEAFNLIGLDYNAVGNHEFDEGIEELIRMQEGGCHSADGCRAGGRFAGATFQFLAANVLSKNDGRPVFPAYRIHDFGGPRIAFVGMTLEGTPSIVTSSAVAGLRFLDEAETVNALVPELKKQGIEAVVVMVHEGAMPAARSPYDGCVNLSGPLVDIVSRLDDEVDVVISGHTHLPYNCRIGNKLVTSAFSFGRLITKIDLALDRRSGEVVSASASNRVVTRDVARHSGMTALLDRYNAVAGPLINRVIGSVSADIVRTLNEAGESALGDVIADAQLDATDDPGLGDADVAFTNSGGIRADLVYAGAGEGRGAVTYGEMFTIQPFGNSLVTMTLTGAQIHALLEQQFSGCRGQTGTRILQVSAGFSYTWSNSAPPCGKVDPASITIRGLRADPGALYRVTVNSYLAEGGDNFSILKDGTDRLGGDVDVDAAEKFFATRSPIRPGPQNRIARVP